MSSSPPPTKRKRTEAGKVELDSTPLPADAVERSAQFWFDDGNVVLQAEATQFRVHRSILSCHSPIMKDCFECPQPKGAPTIEGCPLVHLPDSAKDINNMCGHLYGFYQTDLKRVTSSYLETMLLMGRKYEIASFTTSAECCLQQLFPSTLEKWDACQEDVKRISARNKGFIFDVFNSVYEYPMPSIMQPLLMSMCTIHSLAQITSGISRRGHRAILTPSAKQYCVMGRLIFVQLALEKFMAFYCEIENEEKFEFTIPTSTCFSPANCLSLLRNITTNIVTRNATSHAVAFPPPATRPGPYTGDDLCFPCFAHLQELIGESRHLVWKSLPNALAVLKTP